jgi:4-amino-4-deoxy-L-arabinose transferase-like glycosyltransferase
MGKRAWVFAWGYVALLFVGFWSYGLFDYDEGIYSAALGEMLRKGEWIVITIGDKPFFEKPILLYWLGMVFTKLGVPGEAALRLPSVLATLGTLWITASFARRQFGDTVAFWSVLILASSSFFMAIGRMFIPDPALVFFLSAALFTFWQSIEGDWRLRWVSAGCLGIATLAKGPMPAFVFLAAVLYVIWRIPETRPSLRRGWVVGTVIFAAVVSSWFVPVYLAKGSEFFSQFILRQNLGRLGGADTAHLGPFWYYIPVVLVLFVPFSFFGWQAWGNSRSSPVERFMWAWILIVFLLFSAAGSKLPHYILPIAPPLAILLAKTAVSSRPRLWWGGAFSLVLGLLLLGAAYFAPKYMSLAISCGAASVLGGLIALWIGARKGGVALQAFCSIAPFTLCTLLVGPYGYWQITMRPPQDLARRAKAVGIPLVEYRMGGEKVSGATSHPSICWYLGYTTEKATTPVELVTLIRAQRMILSRRDRMAEALPALAEAAVEVRQVDAIGEYQLFLATPFAQQ